MQNLSHVLRALIINAYLSLLDEELILWMKGDEYICFLVWLQPGTLYDPVCFIQNGLFLQAPAPVSRKMSGL